MTVPLILDLAVAVLALSTGAWVLFARDAMTAVIGFIVYGLVLTLIWVRLSAIDVALTEAAIGGGLTGVLLIGAASRLDRKQIPAGKGGLPARISAALLSASIATSFAWIVTAEPASGLSLASLVLEHLPDSGLGNPVAGVLFVYRALDTLLEKIVLLLALLGVWSLALDCAWPGIPGLRTFPYKDDTLALLARWLPPIGCLFGIYMCWAGASQPGGAFQGGAILAAMWLLLMLAGVKPVPASNGILLRLSLVAGPALFLAVGLAGFAIAGGFLAYPLDYAKALIVGIELALTLSIATVLGLLAAGTPERPVPP